jgi:hypothetical protein
MVIRFSVRVVDQAGNPLEGADVAIQYPWAFEHGWSDKDGWVRFEKTTAFGDTVNATIYIEGVLRDSGSWIEDGTTLVYTI